MLISVFYLMVAYVFVSVAGAASETIIPALTKHIPSNAASLCGYAGNKRTLLLLIAVSFFCIAVHAPAFSADIDAPAIIDNQSGDDTWRSSNTALYDIDFTDTGDAHLSRFQVRACTTNSNCGDIIDWTDTVTGLSPADLYDTDWALPSVVWDALPAGTSYISVRAYDGSDNATDSGPLFYVKVDRATPAVIFDTPADSSWFGSDFVIGVTDSDSGGSGLATCSYKVESFTSTVWEVERDWAAGTRVCNSATSATITVGPGMDCRKQPELFSANCRVSVKAVDAAGNESDIASMTYKIDYTNPVIGAVIPSNTSHLQYVDGIFDLSATVNDKASGSGVDYCEYCLSADGVCDTEWASATWAGTCSTTGLACADGATVTLNMQAQDMMGNLGTGTQVQRKCDTSPPSVTFNSPAASSSPPNVFGIDVSESDPLAGSVPGSGIDYCEYMVESYNITSTSWVPTKDWKYRKCDNTVSTMISVGPDGDCRDDGTDSCRVSIRSRDHVGNIAAVASRTFTIAMFSDSSAPSDISSVADSTGADVAYSSSPTNLSANWPPASDSESGIARYWFSIGTTSGASDTAGWWTDNAIATDTTKTGLALTEGQIYYVTVKAENGVGLMSGETITDGQIVDSTAPSAITTVNDGPYNDITYSTAVDTLDANWTSSSDSISGITRYWYGIGTSPGAVNTRGWTDNGLATSVNVTGLPTLSNGTIYYFSVKAENGSEIMSSTNVSNGVKIDRNAPIPIATVNDGTGADIAYTTSLTQLSSNWPATSDPQSGVTRYWYAIGTAAGATDVVDWTDNGASTAVSKSGLSLTNGQKYFFSVKAENGAELLSTSTNSNGQTVDITPPSDVSALNDGAGADIVFAPSASQLSANWSAAADAESGIAKYWYSIGTTSGASDVVAWTATTTAYVTKTGLSLSSGQIYYFSVIAQNGAGLLSSALTSNGQTVDPSPPITIAAVSDGPAGDLTYSTATSDLDANWATTSDDISGVTRYWYAVGTTAGATDVAGWTDNALATGATVTGLTLADAQMYYFSVSAENGAGLLSTPADSNGILIDRTPPSDVASVFDGASDDIAFSSSSAQLIANWSASSDAQSGVARYWYAIGTTAGATDVADWTDNAAATGVTRTGLSLTDGQAYSFSVIAENGAGLLSSPVNSNGLIVDTSPPADVASVFDGTGADIVYTASSTVLSANWADSSDAQSGIAKYWYAIGTAAGATDVADWTDNSAATAATKTGLSLSDGQPYYFSIKAENNAGLFSSPVSSNGQTADLAPPAAVSIVNDGDSSDIDYSTDSTALAANWSSTTDALSGMSGYRYAIGTTAGATDVVDWTGAALATGTAETGLSLTNGQAYFFTVKAEDNVGNLSPASDSDGVIIDITPPLDVPSVSDGTGADVSYWCLTSQLSANWAASSDAQSGIAGYLYAIGTAAGATDVADWTDNASATSATKTGLALADGQAYYFSAIAVNGAGLLSSPASSNGVIVDTSPPADVGYVYDGTGADILFEPATSQLSANWGASSDSESGIAGYWYSIGTTAGASDVVAWTDIGAATGVTKTGLALINGQDYYFSVVAQNNAGLVSSVPITSDGQIVDYTPPPAVASVNDGTGVDITYKLSLSELSANWPVTSDAESGILRYWYSIGAAAGASDVVAWTDIGISTGTTVTGLSLTNGQKYYFNVAAENNAGGVSSVASSDGQIVDITPPSGVPSVNDGAGADRDFTGTSAELTSNWPAAADAESGIARYWYAAGSSPGATDVVDWTDNALPLGVTKTGLSLTDNQTYYFSIMAENNVGLLSGPVVSDGQTIDLTPPSDIATLNDGTGADILYSTSAITLSANWSASSDMQSGIARYIYSIGTTAGASDTAGWTDNGTALSVSRTGLSLTDGQMYYFTVRAENTAGLLSTPITSNGQIAVFDRPAKISLVNDGNGADVSFTMSTSQLSANWAPSYDGFSGIIRYMYAIGTTPEATDVVDWTDNALLTYVTKNGLSLSNGSTYYFTVVAENGVNKLSLPTSSDGQTVDLTPPTDISRVNDGTGADSAFAGSLTELSANWSPASDPQSGIARYIYFIGTSPGSMDVASRTAAPFNSATKTGLSLTDGRTYYFTVKAENGAGLTSNVTSSNGQTVDATPPSVIATVNDGEGADISYATSTGKLSANWSASDDPQSGVARYLYSIGTAAGASDTLAWTDNGAAISVVKTGLALTDGKTYYFSVKAENGAGVFSAPVSSNGQMYDSSPPANIALVRDGADADIGYSSSSTQITANWSASSDPHSGIAGYWLAVGSSACATDVADWTNVSVSLNATKTGLSLTDMSTYYVSVKAQNGAGLMSSPACSDGQTIDTTPPAAVSVNDGTGDDIDTSTSTNGISANWSPSSDSQSGIVRYWYAVGTSASAQNIVGWTDNGTNTSITLDSLALTDGKMYYTMVKPENGAGGYGPTAVSDGFLMSLTGAPYIPADSEWMNFASCKENFSVDAGTIFGATGSYSIVYFENGKYNYVADAPTVSLTHARGYWISSDRKDIAIPITTGSDYTGGSHETALFAGWNAVSTPYCYPVPWSQAQVRLRCGGADQPLRHIYLYNSQSGAYSDIAPESGFALKPWSVYWMKTDRTDCTLVISAE